MKRTEDFADKWLPTLNNGAKAVVRHAAVATQPTGHAKTADEFVQSLGFAAIGYNWELLDAGAEPSEPRSALKELHSALAQDIDNPNRPWLTDDVAARCAREFLDLFDPASRTIVSNRYDGLWNPIAGGAVEWGFVGFDEQVIALLLIMSDQ